LMVLVDQLKTENVALRAALNLGAGDEYHITRVVRGT
jgi:hypothetical protein